MRADAAAAFFASLLLGGGAVAQNCAPANPYGTAPSSSVPSICFSASNGMPGSTVDAGLSLWDSNCSGIGTGIPAFVGPGGGGTCGTGSIYVEVTYSPNSEPHGYDATTQVQPGNGGPITGAVITCYVNVCSDQLLAHEIGHVLGLGDATDAACDGTIMMQSPTIPRTNFTEGCSAADAAWTGPGDNSGGGSCESGCGQDVGNGSPILIPLGMDSYRLTGLEDPVRFDIDDDGIADVMGWTARDSSIGFLALDRNGNGGIDDGHELFGTGSILRNGAHAQNGFEALREFDQNQDGVIDASDPIWKELVVWIDADHNAISTPGELIPIARTNVRSIVLDYRWVGRRDEHGNLFRYRSHITIGSGRAPRPIYDIFFVMNR